MKWYFAVNARSLTSARPYWEELISVAVSSARRHTSLVPHLIYDGPEDPFFSTLRRWGVEIIHHRVSFADALESHSVDPMYSHIACGAFLRTEIPLLNITDEIILYTDCDVMFRGRLPHLDVPQFFACAPESSKENFADFNTGVMLMNLPTLRDSFTEFRDFILKNLSRLGSFDQDAYRLFYNDQASRLPIELNWKPYWGANDAATVVHFHGPKPDWLAEHVDGVDGEGVLASMLNWNKEGYRHYLDIWRNELRSARQNLNFMDAD